MRIFLISNMYPSTKDQLFGVFVKNFKIELEKHGVIFSKEALIKGKSLSPVIKLLKYFLHYLRCIFFYFSSGYDIIYIHFLTHHIPILELLLAFKKKPIVVNVHGSDIIGLKDREFLNNRARMVLKKIDALVVPTIYFKEKVRELYPFMPENKIFVSPSGGIDLDKFHKTKTNINRNTCLTLGLVSRLTEEKGWRVFMDAMVLLKKKNVQFKALIAGKGPDENKIIHEIKDHNLDKEVDFLGFVPQNELINIYNKIDIYVFPTYREAESLGLTGLEAMACGTPVIASNIAGPSTYVHDGMNGFLFPPRNSKYLASTIEKYCMMKPEKRAKICEHAIETAKEYGQSKVAFNLKTKLEFLVNENSNS